VAAPEDTGGPGAVTMFSRSPSGWSQDGPKVMPLKTGGNFCVPGVTTGSPSSIALSGNGQVLAIGGPTWGDFKGCVWVFSRISSRWTQRAEFVCPPGSHGAYIYGGSIALTANGKTMLVGSSRDGVEGGEAWSYTQKHGSWNTAAKALDTKGVFDLGIQGLTEVSISADGRTALLGEMSFNSNVGAAWIFTRSGQKWHQSGKRMRPKDESGFAGQFAYSVALSDDGSTALIGGNNDNRVGAAWLFSRIR
jgi:hypothetical protein